MTIGEHLEELRWRLILGLIGFFIAAVACMAMGESLIHIFLRPLVIAQRHAHQNPMVYYTEIAESFMTYLKVALPLMLMSIVAAHIYLVWRFF